MIRADLKAAGIEFETEAGRADFHSLRVSFASNLGRSGVPIQTARELMRHSTVELTARVYTKLDRGDLEGAVCRLPGLESPIPSTPPSLSKSDENQPQVAADRLSKQPKNFPIQFPIADDFSGLSVASLATRRI